MNDEKLVRWQKVDGLPGSFEVDALHDDDKGFRLVCQSERAGSRAFMLRFQSVIAYRLVNESYRLRLVGGGVSCGVYIVENSRLVAWLLDESYGAWNSARLMHYLLVAAEDVVDVVSEWEPVVEWR